MPTAILTILCVAIISPMFGFLFGAFSGFVVGLFFADTIFAFFSHFGINDLTMWQIGGSLGFIGGFFKTTVSSK